jgi:hypothetical protein
MLYNHVRHYSVQCQQWQRKFRLKLMESLDLSIDLCQTFIYPSLSVISIYLNYLDSLALQRARSLAHDTLSLTLTE